MAVTTPFLMMTQLKTIAGRPCCPRPVSVYRPLQSFRSARACVCVCVWEEKQNKASKMTPCFWSASVCVCVCCFSPMRTGPTSSAAIAVSICYRMYPLLKIRFPVRTLHHILQQQYSGRVGRNHVAPVRFGSAIRRRPCVVV